MKRTFFLDLPLGLLLLLVSGVLSAQTYDMSSTPISTCSGTYRDDGGAANYTNSQDITQTISPNAAGNYIILTFTSFDIESNTGCTWDYLEIYDGPNTASPLLGRYCGTALPGPLTSTAAGGELTLKFHSDGSVNKAGWVATISCTSTPPPATILLNDNVAVSSCNAKFYDMGGASNNYSNSQDFTKTISPDNGGKLQITFNSFNIESNTGCTWDYLEIYDGPNTASPLLGRFCGITNPGPFTSTAAGGELTFKFHSDGSTVKAGWDADISCTAAAPCTAPTNLNASAIGPQQANLSWVETGAATLWDIELGVSGFTPTGTPTVNNTSTNPHTYTGLTPSTSYDFYVRADCGGTQSGWSGPFTFTTTACNIQAPTALNAINVYSTSADLTWTENGNATMWDIELGVSGFTPTGTPTANNVTSNPYTYSGLTSATTYDYYVRADCGGGNSAWVGPFTFTTSSFPSNYTSELVDGWARGVIQDPSGNYVWAGYATNNGSDFQVVKTDQGGNIIWTETIGESGTEMAFDIVNSGDGGYVIAGHTNSATLIASGSYDIMVTKLDANGNHVWTRVLGTSGSEYSSQCSIIRNPDNTFSVAAITVSDMLFAQIAANGTLLAMKTLNTQSSWAYALTKASGTNGGWAVAGRYSGPFGGSEFMVTKLKSDGIYDWSMVWGDGTGTGEILYAIVENAADDYTVFGYTYAEGTTPQNMYATRFTNSGSGPTVSWIKAYGTANGCAIYDAVKASDGNYIVTGYCFGGSYTDTYLMKINAATGAIIWQTEKPDDGSSNRQGDGVYIDAAGSYLVAGLGGFDMLKFAPDGTICGGIAGTAITDDLGTTYPYVDLTEGNSNNTFGGSNIARTPTIASFGTPLPGCNAVLPVKLTSFNAICENQGVRCDWQTSAEINNHYFTVERSTDALNFETIGTVYGNGTSHSAHTYSFIDDQPLSGKAYYRLKQTDYDGKSEYFQVKSVECGGQEITIYPNPFEDFIQLNVNTPENSPVEVIIENNLGQVVFEKQLVLDAAASRIDLPSTIRKGMYQVYIIGNSKILQVEKLIKL